MMFRISLLACIIGMFYSPSKAQIWELSSDRNIDMSSKSTHSEQTAIIIDSGRITLTIGTLNYYYDITDQGKDGSNYTYKLIDKNDDEVDVMFSTSTKIFDYHLHDFFIRYLLNKVTKVIPPLTDAEKKAKAKQDSIKKLSDTTDVGEREDTTVYDEAEVMPEYPGGKSEMMSYLSKNIHYPKAAKDQKIHGFVTVTAVVEKDGHLNHVTATQDIGGGCGQEAVRVVKGMPHWSVGENKGENVRVSVTIPVSFMPPPK
jgi:TonB family protein